MASEAAGSCVTLSELRLLSWHGIPGPKWPCYTSCKRKNDRCRVVRNPGFDWGGWLESLQSLKETNGNHGQLALDSSNSIWEVKCIRSIHEIQGCFEAEPVIFWFPFLKLQDDLRWFVWFLPKQWQKPCNHQGFGSQLEDFLLFCWSLLVHFGAPSRTGGWSAWSLDLWLRSSEHLPHCPSMRRMTLRAMAEMRVGLLIPNFATDWHMSWFPGLDSCWEHW